MSAEQPPQQPCPPEILASIKLMEEIMSSREYNHAGIPMQLALELMKAGLLGSFSEFERCLRESGSRVHFIAVPLDFFGDQYATKYPLGKSGEPEYTLFTAVNGPEEAALMLDQIGVTAEENVQRLETTGVLTVE